jgi:hypothetical protein
VSELPSSEDLDPSTGTDAPTPPTTTGPSSYTLNWEEPRNLDPAEPDKVPQDVPGPFRQHSSPMVLAARHLKQGPQQPLNLGLIGRELQVGHRTSLIDRGPAPV